jgi:hypothetical protein
VLGPSCGLLEFCDFVLIDRFPFGQQVDCEKAISVVIPNACYMSLQGRGLPPSSASFPEPAEGRTEPTRGNQNCPHLCCLTPSFLTFSFKVVQNAHCIKRGKYKTFKKGERQSPLHSYHLETPALNVYTHVYSSSLLAPIVE